MIGVSDLLLGVRLSFCLGGGTSFNTPLPFTCCCSRKLREETRVCFCLTASVVLREYALWPQRGTRYWCVCECVCERYKLVVPDGGQSLLLLLILFYTTNTAVSKRNVFTFVLLLTSSIRRSSPDWLTLSLLTPRLSFRTLL